MALAQTVFGTDQKTTGGKGDSPPPTSYRTKPKSYLKLIKNIYFPKVNSFFNGYFHDRESSALPGPLNLIDLWKHG